GGYSPPAWRRLGNGDRSSGFWRMGDDLLGYGGLPPSGSGYRGRDLLSPGYDRADDGFYGCGDEVKLDDDDDDDDDDEDTLAAAIRTRLPTGSMSPVRERSLEPGYYYNRLRSRSASRGFGAQQRATTPVEAVIINPVRNIYRKATKSWTSLLLSVFVAFMSLAAARVLFEPLDEKPVPDLITVANLAAGFEPLIYYSENNFAQVTDLRDNGIAVWDLGETVRWSNLPSAPLISKALNELSESFTALPIELIKFFAQVDGDIDGILMAMHLARRELSRVSSTPPAPLAFAYDNLHSRLASAGILETPTGHPTRLGAIVISIFGMSGPQRTQRALQRAFDRLMDVVERAIDNELQQSLTPFSLFEAVDQQFLVLAETVVEEANAQDEMYADQLSSLWVRLLGTKISELMKYERNRLILQDVRGTTLRTRGMLVEHNHKLLALKASLETLRQRLVSPLARSVNSTTLSMDEQIRGLEDVRLHLEGMRSRQKTRMMEMLVGTGSG
ncbi:hypothetical protein M406DRAFT_238285, partial [Cryphonectria parasitica EP155]